MYPETDQHIHYVYIRNAGRTALLAGPFNSRPEAEKYTQRSLKLAEEIDAFAWDYEHGTLRAARRPGRPAPVGKFNQSLDIAVAP